MGTIKGIFFDQDGVIIDTERDGHRVAFNETFRDFGYDFSWSVDEYHQLLQIAGGKERMRHYLHTRGFGVEVRPEDEDELIRTLHKHKTEKFVELIESEALPVRSGVRRIMQAANAAGLILGVCTTSNVRSAKAVAYGILADVKFDFVLAGDVVQKKKPDPEIYNLALKRTGLQPEEVIVFEDSHNGVEAAKAAGLYVVATTNGYTEGEDLGKADLIVTALGDPDGEKGELKKGVPGLVFQGVLYLDQLVANFSN